MNTRQPSSGTWYFLSFSFLHSLSFFKYSSVMSLSPPTGAGRSPRKTHLNLERVYGFTLRQEGKGVLAFRFDDPDRAIAALRKKGINLVSSVDLFERLES